ncbi:hypothetical protein JCM12856_16300 [Spirochaeta dissipatitropha]
MTVDQEAAGDQLRGMVENAVIGEFFDRGFIVWSDVPQGFLAAAGNPDGRLPAMMEYAAVRFARQDGADYLVQIKLPPVGELLKSEVVYSLTDVRQPRVLFSGSIQGTDLGNENNDARNVALRIARELVENSYAEIHKVADAW